MLAVGVVDSLVNLREPGNLSGDEVEDGELALANLAVDHPWAEDERGEPEGGAEGDEGNDERLGQLDRVHGCEERWLNEIEKRLAAGLQCDLVAAAESQRPAKFRRSGASGHRSLPVF